MIKIRAIMKEHIWKVDYDSQSKLLQLMCSVYQFLEWLVVADHVCVSHPIVTDLTTVIKMKQKTCVLTIALLVPALLLQLVTVLLYQVRTSTALWSTVNGLIRLHPFWLETRNSNHGGARHRSS
jgi:hypothetical protein